MALLPLPKVLSYFGKRENESIPIEFDNKKGILSKRGIEYNGQSYHSITAFVQQVFYNSGFNSKVGKTQFKRVVINKVSYETVVNWIKQQTNTPTSTAALTSTTATALFPKTIYSKSQTKEQDFSQLLHGHKILFENQSAVRNWLNQRSHIVSKLKLHGDTQEKFNEWLQSKVVSPSYIMLFYSTLFCLCFENITSLIMDIKKASFLKNSVVIEDKSIITCELSVFSKMS